VRGGSRVAAAARIGAAVALAWLLGSCTAISTLSSAGEPLDTYELRPVPAASITVRGDRHLVVEQPTTSGALATDRIAVKQPTLEVSYLPGARWVDAAPDHVRLLLSRSLEGTGAFALVSAGGGRPDPDWYLATDLRAFEVQLDAAGTGRVVVRLRGTMVSDVDRRVRGARTFERTVPLADLDEGSVIAAFDVATRAVLGEVVGWATGTARS
jgi:cholesterol transport system auxiliary component